MSGHDFFGAASEIIFVRVESVGWGSACCELCNFG